MRRAKKAVAALVVIALLASVCPGMGISALSPGLGNFKTVNSYGGQFSDVKTTDWYYDNVVTAFELGLMKGSGNLFSPNGNITLAETIVAAARIHSIYHTGGESFIQQGVWYQTYVDYALVNGIISAPYADYNKSAARAEFAAILSKALPDPALQAINIVADGAIPDVPAAAGYAPAVYRLYRAGILTGNDAQGTFTPDSNITRCVAAAVVTRMADESLRRGISLSYIKEFNITRSFGQISSDGDIEPFSSHWFGESANMSGCDFSKNPALPYTLTFSDKTVFPGAGGLPAGFEGKALLEWGKYPGLNVDILHEFGFTGTGAVVAYVDQPAMGHSEYSGDKLHYSDLVTEPLGDNSMHGPAVLSLLMGKSIGTAPDSDVYFLENPSWKTDQTTHADCLYKLIELNKSLPESKKITMVGFSDTVDPGEANPQAFRDAITACEKAGIMVWLCNEPVQLMSADFLPLSDKNNASNVVPASWVQYAPANCLYVPTGGRTTAATFGGAAVIYWSEGGVSWATPYVLGLAGIANTIDKSLTQDDMLSLLMTTAYQVNGIRVINPVGFIAAVLKGAGRSEEAVKLLSEEAARRNYVYALFNSEKMTAADTEAMSAHLAGLTDARVLLFDVKGLSSAEEIYKALQSDAAQRGGTVKGVQIFGTSAMVPAFRLGYKAQMGSAVDDGGVFLSDFFYSNFSNDAAVIARDFSVYDNFEKKLGADLTPLWPVARLPLAAGEFAPYFERYKAFTAATGLLQMDIVNFSSPIFATPAHPDDMGHFLNRLKNEFRLLKVPYRLYGNLDGKYPVTTQVLGNFTTDNIHKENESGMCEFVINGHGQWNNTDQSVFEGSSTKEKRVSFLNMDNINAALGLNPYYLDMWTCLNGFDMKNNLITTALNGKCVGAFAATAIISNNGVDNKASPEKMKYNNFYWFYYSYFKALYEGENRSDAFFKAQSAYAKALLANTGRLDPNANYQFNLCNLLTYHNFGVLEVNAAASLLIKSSPGVAAGTGTIQSGSSGTGGGTGGSGTFYNAAVTDGKVIASETLAFGESTPPGSGINFSGLTVFKLDNGRIRFTIDLTSTEQFDVYAFDPPDGNILKAKLADIKPGDTAISFEADQAVLKQIMLLTCSFNRGNTRAFLFIDAFEYAKVLALCG